MSHPETPPERKPKRGKRRIKVDIDLEADLSGFGSARIATPAHHRIVRHYSSPFFLGPPPTDDLLALVMHIYTADEADLVQHLPPFLPRSAQQVAARAARPVDDVRRVLDHLAFTKLVLWSFGEHIWTSEGRRRRYVLMPLVPGTFEMALMTPDLSTRNAWHRTFAEIFERIYDTGFLTAYVDTGRPLVRYLPLGPVVRSLNMAWPSDNLEQILENYDLFAVGNCQCRLAMGLVEKSCGRPLQNCLAIGPFARPFLERGQMRRVDRAEALAIKREAEKSGLVTWMINNRINDPRGNVSCSCCGCCCHGLRTISELNTPGLVSRPHFMPARDRLMCNDCGLCVKACPMGAWSMRSETLVLQSVRCIGCGLCVVACNYGALQLRPVRGARPPDSTWPVHVLKMLPGSLAAGLGVWVRRLLGQGTAPA